MKIFRKILFTLMVVAGLTLSASAQKDDQKKPPKERPPVIDPAKKPPRENPPRDNPPREGDKPKKPGIYGFVVLRERGRNEVR